MSNLFNVRSRIHCLIIKYYVSIKYKFGKNMALHFVTVCSQRASAHVFLNIRLPGPRASRFKMAAIIRFDFDFSKMIRQCGCCTTVVVMRYKFINKTEKGLLYIQFSCQTSLIHSYTILQFLGAESLLLVFHTYFTLSLAS